MVTISESEYLRQNSATLDLIKEDHKVSIFKVYHADSGKVCIQKRYKASFQRNDTSKLAELYSKLQELQAASPDLLMHTAKIYSVYLIGDDTEVDACIEEAFVQGNTLDEILEEQGKTGLAEAKVVEFILQICDGLSVLHRQDPPIVHRDLKPGNLMITEEGICKIIDFDISREAVPGKTRDTVFMGTREYIPPEQTGGHQTVPASDIYNIGVVMHELLVGVEQHNDVTQGESFCYAHDRIKYDGILRDVIIKCTQIDLNNRYQNADELKQALLEVQNIENKNAPLKAQPKKQKRHLPIALGCILALVILVALFSRFLKLPGKNKSGSDVYHESAQNQIVSDAEASMQPSLSVLTDSKNEAAEQVEEISESVDANTGADIGIPSITTAEQNPLEPPFTATFEPSKYMKDGVLDLVDCGGQYAYLAAENDFDGNVRYYFGRENGEKVDLTDYYGENDGSAHLAFDLYHSKLYLVTDAVSIYLISDKSELSLQYEAAPDKISSPWNCAFFSDGRMFCGANGTYVDTSTWEECGTAVKRLEVISNDTEYATKDGWDEDYYELDSRGQRVSSWPFAWSSNSCLFTTDGDVLFRLVYDRITYWNNSEWKDYTEQLTFNQAFRCNFLSKTDYGFLCYDPNSGQITKIIVNTN